MKKHTRGRSPLRLTLALLLLPMMLSLMGCVHRHPVPRETWVKPIYLQEETIEWLKAHKPWPQSLRDDLDQIRRHNEKYEAIVGPATRPADR